MNNMRGILIKIHFHTHFIVLAKCLQSAMQMTKQHDKGNGQMKESIINDVCYVSHKYISNYKYYIRLRFNCWLHFRFFSSFIDSKHMMPKAISFLTFYLNEMKLCWKEIENVTEIHWKLKCLKLHCENSRTTADFLHLMSLEPCKEMPIDKTEMQFSEKPSFKFLVTALKYWILKWKIYWEHFLSF